MTHSCDGRDSSTGLKRLATAHTRADAVAKATEIVERIGRGTDTDLRRAKGADLVGHYLDPRRRPPRVPHGRSTTATRAAFVALTH